MFSKLFEKAVHSRLLDNLLKHKLITSRQHGYLRNHLTETVIINFLKYICIAMNDKKVAVGVFFNYSKAFDCLDHDTLLIELEYLGVRGTPLK